MTSTPMNCTLENELIKLKLVPKNFGNAWTTKEKQMVTQAQ